MCIVARQARCVCDEMVVMPLNRVILYLILELIDLITF